MLFNSRVFLFVFLPVAYFVFWKLQSKQLRYVWLTINGYAFYSFWNYKFCALMAISTLVSYFAGLGFLRVQGPARRKLFLIVPIVVDLSLLGFFKYFRYFNLALSYVEWTVSFAGLEHISNLLWTISAPSVRISPTGTLAPTAISPPWVSVSSVASIAR